MLTVQIVIAVAGETTGAPGVAQTFAFSKVSPTPPLVTLSLADDTGITSYAWSILDQPQGDSAVLSDATAASPTFTPTASVVGTYLIQCIVNSGAGYARNALAFTTQYLDLRIPAAGEILQYSSSKGWAAALRTMIMAIDSNSQGEGIRKAAVTAITDCTAAPPTEVTGDRYILDNTSGAVHPYWDGAAKWDIVQFDGVDWIAETPVEGWSCYVDDDDMDAIYVDDGTPAWELRVVSTAWESGAGTSAILRTGNTLGTAAGDYALNAGWGGSVTADYASQFGRDNIVGSGSDYSAAFGGGDSGATEHNIIGGTTASPWSYAFGVGNAVDADPVGTLGLNFVIGSDNDVDTDYTFCFGDGNNVDDTANSNGFNMVVGQNNVVDGYGNFVGGIGIELATSDGNFAIGASHTLTSVTACGCIGILNEISGDYCLALGYDNLLLSDYAFAHGDGHTVNLACEYTAVFGDTATLGDTYGSPYSLVVGLNNDVDGTASQLGFNYVFGTTNNVDADKVLVAGESMVIGGDAKYSIIVGKSNTYTGSRYGGVAIFGEGHTSTADRVLISGSTNSLSSGYCSVGGGANTLGAEATTYSIVHGNNILLGATNVTEYSAAFGQDISMDGRSGGVGYNIAAGYSHSIIADYSAVFGNNHSVGSGGSVHAATVGGSSHIVGDSAATLDTTVFGSGNTVNGAGGTSCASIVAGSGHVVTADYCDVSGFENAVVGSYSSVHGEEHVCDYPHTAVFGRYTKPRWDGVIIHGGKRFGSTTDGDFQTVASMPISTTTIGASPSWTEIFYAGTGTFGMQVDSSYFCSVDLVARKRTADGGDTPRTKAFRVDFLAQRGTSGVSIIGTPLVVALFETAADDEADWDVRATATTSYFSIEVLGSADATYAVYWQGGLRCQEVCTTRAA